MEKKWKKFNFSLSDDEDEKEQLEFDGIEYVPIEIERLMNGSRSLKCDVFLKLSKKKMTRVFSIDTGLDYRRLAQYVSKGHENVYVKKEEESIFTTYLEQTPKSILDNKSFSHEDRLHALQDVADQCLAGICESLEFTKPMLERSKVVLKNVISSMHNEPDLLIAFLKSISDRDYLLKHSIGTAVVSMLVCEHSGSATKRMSEICAIGGFFHDIGMSKISREIMLKDGELTPKELKELKTHPKLGVRMIQDSPDVPEEVGLIIMQHHEEPGGDGYPLGLRSPKIYFPAKVVSVVDAFCYLVTDKGERQAYHPLEALKIMEKNIGKYDKDVFSVLRKFFRKEFKKAA